MQGKKIYQEKLFNQFRLSDRVPENNFYRRLKAVLNLEYLYQLTKEYYGDSGQKSIDPVVFYKLCLVGYVENIISDRNLITHCRKKFSVTYYRDQYERNNQRLKTEKGKQAKAKRQSTVEPVFGTLTQYLGMRKVNVRGLAGANKVMLMAATAYNIKKLLKFKTNFVKSQSKALVLSYLKIKTLIKVKLAILRHLNCSIKNTNL